MAYAIERSVALRDGQTLIVRTAEQKDALAVNQLARAVISEEIHHLTSAVEFEMSVEDSQKWLDAHFTNTYWLALVGEIGDQVVAILDFENGHRQRISHTGSFGLSVAAAHRCRGIGAHMISFLIDWAQSSGKIEKIDLSVHSNNHQALRLYKSLGFVQEGLRRQDLKYESHYVDTVLMSLFLKDRDLEKYYRP